MMGTRGLMAAAVMGAMMLAVVQQPAAAQGAEPLPAEAVSIVPPPGEGADKQWPRWRGWSGQGYVKGEGYVDRWSDTQNVLWKVQVPGDGNSSPVVWEDQILLTTAYDDGRRRSIIAFDRETGEQTWETFAPVEATPENAHGKNGWASGTVTTDGQHIYAYLGNHGLLAVDMKGEIAWHVDLGDISSLHGSACSPLLYEDRVIVYQDKPGGGFIAAFDAETGDELWWTSRDETVGWGSPLAIRVGDRDEIIVSSQHRVYAYDPQTGGELWRCEGTTVEVTPSPVVGHGMLFASSGRAGPTLAIVPGGEGDVTNTHIVWRARRGSPFIPSPIVHGDYLFMITDTLGVVTCYEATTGEVAGRVRLPLDTSGEAFSASPVVVDDKLFFTADDGLTVVLTADPELEVLHINDIGERMLASPAVLDGRWYMRTAGHLMAIGEE